MTKIRLTGGEPTVRQDLVPLVRAIGSLRKSGLKELCLTTNGLTLYRKLDAMVEAGLTGINLSLDTLDPFQFQIMTRRDGFHAVMRSMEHILALKKLGADLKLKLNCVVMRNINEKDIIPFVELGREKDLEVRFIEYMPFDGNRWKHEKMMGYQEMVNLIKAMYPGLRKVADQPHNTSRTYQVPGFQGRVGFITSMTKNFCSECNRLRITSDGNLKVCLFGNAEVSLKDIMRKSNGGNPWTEKFSVDLRNGQDAVISLRPEDKRELMDLVGVAVQRKKAKHAGMDELAGLKNRPMILIGG